MRVFTEMMSGFLLVFGLFLYLVAGPGLDGTVGFWVGVAGVVIALIGLDWRITQIIKKSRND